MSQWSLSGTNLSSCRESNVRSENYLNMTVYIVSSGIFKNGDTYSVFRVENVRGRRIVDNDDVTELSSQPAEVFDIVPSVKNTGFSEESRSKHAPLVQQVCHRVCILSNTNKHTNVTLPI